MASTSDDVVYAMAQKSQSVEEYFGTKQWLWSSDQNNRSYTSGQVNFELSQFANSGRWINYSEAYMTVPLVIALKSDEDATAKEVGAFGFNLKNGFNQLVDSLEVMLNNVSVVQMTPYSNMFTNFKLLTSMSQDSLAKYGAILNFFPDDWRAQDYTNATSTSGLGVNCNNSVFVAQSYAGDAKYPVGIVNSGLVKRLYNLNFPSTGVNWGFYSNLSTIGKSNWRSNGGVGASRVYYVQSIATIRLKDLSDFFNQLGLCRNAFIKLNVNFNLGRSDIGVASSKFGAVTNYLTSRTNPLMICSANNNSALASFITQTPQVVTLGVGIGSLTLSGVTVSNDLLDACRIYAPSYQMLPDAESQFLEMHPTREITYNDLFQYTISNIPAGSSFNQILSNGVVAPQYIVSVPILASSSNGGLNLSPIQSPYASEPATTSAGMAITQYQIQVSGKNLYQQAFSYDFENFVAEMSAINALDGGKIDTLTSGLVSFDMWQNCYRYYVSDLSRGSGIDSMVPKAIQISGINSTTVAIDLFCFIVYSRKLVLNTIDSEIISVQ